jgi:hypothetical protein
MEQRTRRLCDGVELHLTDRQFAFKRATVTLTRDVTVHSIIPELLRAGTRLKVAPLYPQHRGTALSEEGAVNVRLSKYGTCWIAPGYWK